jgi:hypothetical protein
MSLIRAGVKVKDMLLFKNKFRNTEERYKWLWVVGAASSREQLAATC